MAEFTAPPEHSQNRSVPNSPRSLGLPYNKWRDGQAELIQQILEAPEPCVIIEAPPGIGKSAIAAGSALLTKGKSLILTKQISLMEQYLRDFSFMRTVKGKGNYRCVLPDTNMLVEDAPCQTGWRCAIKAECPYFIQHTQAHSAKTLVTTYSKAFSSFMGNYNLIVCDEGHLIERQVLSAYSIGLNYADFAAAGYTVPMFGSIHEAIDWAESLYNQISRRADQLALVLKQDPNSNPYLKDQWRKIKTIQTPLSSLAMADSSAFWSLEPHRKTFFLRPLWANTHAHKLFSAGAKVVIQSATVLSGERLAALLGIPSFKYIAIPSPFPVERRPLYYCPVAKIGLSSTSEETTKLIEGIDRILDLYKGRRGIIHTVNMTLTEEIAYRSRHKARLIPQLKGIKREEVIDRFLKTPYSVLVSPSVTTGLDGKFDKARFQIIAKVPFEDQGDLATAERLEQDRDWYAYQTAFNLQQAYGRVMRDKADYGETWIVDSNFGWFIRQYNYLFSPWFLEALQQRQLPQVAKKKGKAKKA